MEVASPCRPKRLGERLYNVGLCQLNFTLLGKILVGLQAPNLLLAT